MAPEKGKLIVIEGMDFSGKTTQASLLREEFIKHHISNTMFSEPGISILGLDIKNISKNLSCKQSSPLLRMGLSSISVSDAFDQMIEPILNKGSMVICDRFADYSYAYLCGGEGLSPGIAKTIHELFVSRECKPDLVVVLNISYMTYIKRLTDHNLTMVDSDHVAAMAPDRFNKISTQYEKNKIFSGAHYCSVNGNHREDEVFEDVLIHVNAII